MTQNLGARLHRVLQIRGGDLEDFTSAFEAFKQDRGIRFVLAFSGGADGRDPLTERITERLLSEFGHSLDPDRRRRIVDDAKKEYVAAIVRDVLMPLRGYRIAVLTGGTIWGVPAIATQVGRELGFATIGVYPLAAAQKKQVLPDEMIDLTVCVHPLLGPSMWGDESAAYTKLLDAVIIIGGGAGTMVEVSHLLKQNEKASLRIKHIIPISGTGGTADKLSFFPGRPDIMAKCLPSMPITSGADACTFLTRAVLLEDVFD